MHETHNAWYLGGSGVENVDNCLIIRMEKDTLPGPLVASDVCGNCNREELLVSN